MAVTATAESERQRMQDIDELAKGVPGAEALAAKAKYEEPISADAFARQLLASAATVDSHATDSTEAERASTIEMIAKSANERRK